MDRERIDPEPVSIIAAIIAAASLSVAAANYAKTHLKPAPSRVRAGIVDLLAKLEDEVRQLRADLAALREIFATAEYANDRAIRVRNGAYLTPANFLRYQAVSDDVYRRLRQLNKIGLKLEKQVGRSSTLTTQATTNLLGKAYEKLERLLDAKRLAEADAWSELDQLLELVQQAIAEVRQQLG